MQKWFGDLAGRRRKRSALSPRRTLSSTRRVPNRAPAYRCTTPAKGSCQKIFPSTFCSLIYGSDEGSYKGAVPFVQGRFNMGGTGVLPFCGDGRKMQLIVSRVPSDVVKVASRMGFHRLLLLPVPAEPVVEVPRRHRWQDHDCRRRAARTCSEGRRKAGEICAPRERKVPHGTLIKMYDYKAPRSNICGELFKKLEEYLLRPMLPLRIIECRPEYKAKVMGVTVWDRFSAWAARGKLEEGFEDGASIQIKLSTGETVPAEVRVFKAEADAGEDTELPQTGLRALINGQSHARRETQFFKGKAVEKEHIGGSMLVTLDCSGLDQTSRNALFLSTRETFREDPLDPELFKKLQNELHTMRA